MTNNIAEILNNLIIISKDGEAGFLTAAENASDPSLKQVLSDRAVSCKQAAEVLQDYVEGLNADPADSGSMLGALHRRWIDLKSLFTGHDDHGILVECERGEAVAKATYEQALEENLPVDIRLMIRNQYDNVLKNYNLVCDLRDQYAGRKANESGN